MVAPVVLATVVVPVTLPNVHVSAVVGSMFNALSTIVADTF